MATILNDNSVVGNSRAITISAVVYIAKNFRFNTTSNEILRLDQNGTPNGRKLTLGPTEGSATLQLATTSTALPAIFTSFTESEGTFYLSEVGEEQESAGETFVSVTFKKAIGSVVTS